MPFKWDTREKKREKRNEKKCPLGGGEWQGGDRWETGGGAPVSPRLLNRPQISVGFRNPAVQGEGSWELHPRDGGEETSCHNPEPKNMCPPKRDENGKWGKNQGHDKRGQAGNFPYGGVNGQTSVTEGCATKGQQPNFKGQIPEKLKTRMKQTERNDIPKNTLVG